MNIHVQYERPSSYGSKVIAKAKVFKNSSKVKVKGHWVKNFGSNGKILSEETYMCNMKGLALMVQKLWPKLKFLKIA